MDTIKLKNVKDLMLECAKTCGKIDIGEIVKLAQRNAIEYTLKVASENANTEVEFQGWLADQHWQMNFKEGEDYEVYVINSSITDLKETIFKDNNL